MRYGLPYKGSKNAIAEWIVDIVAEREKVVLSAASSNSLKATERIYTNCRTYERMSDSRKRLITMESAEQLTLF